MEREIAPLKTTIVGTRTMPGLIDVDRGDVRRLLMRLTLALTGVDITASTP